MINQILQAIEELTLTSTSVTLGFQPGNTPPPRTLTLWAGNTATVTMPPIATVLPNFTTVLNYNVGAQSLSITIKSLTGQIVNISSAATTETVETATISSSNAFATWQASLSDLKWYRTA
jgi:hypothetical protein